MNNLDQIVDRPKWSNGSATIEWINEDEVKISHVNCGEAVLDGGDVESLLQVLISVRQHGRGSRP